MIKKRHIPWLMVLALSASGAAWADRPFLATDTAMLEDDDEEVWSFDGWLEAGGKGDQGWNLAAEYAINPNHSVSFGTGTSRLKIEGVKSYEREFDIGTTWLLVDIARQGFGLGVSAEAEFARDDGRTDYAGLHLGLPVSWRNDSGMLRAHANLGWSKPRHDEGFATWSLAGEYELNPHNVVFLEVAGDRSEEDGKLFHGGLRHWLRPGKFALDATVGERRSEGLKVPFVTIGLSIFDVKGGS